MGETLKAEELNRLLSEYAAGTIDEMDRQTLLRAALEDQRIFEALAAEQPLADLMADPSARAELRATLGEKQPWSFTAWLWRPWPVTAAASVMVAVLAVVVVLYLPTDGDRAKPTQVAELREDKRIMPVAAPPSASSTPAAPATLRADETARSVPVPSRKQPASRREQVSSGPPTTAISGAVGVVPGGVVGGVPGGVTGGVIGGVETPAQTFKDERAAESRDMAVEKKLIAETAANPPSTTYSRTIGAVPGGVVGGVVGGIAAPTQAFKEERETEARAIRVEKNVMAGVESPQARTSGAAITYRLLRRGADGNFQEVLSGTPFRVGDAVQVRLETGTHGYLSVVEQLENGTYRLVYPIDGKAGSRVTAHASILIPQAGALVIGTPIRERLLLALFTPEPHGVIVSPDGSLVRPATATVLEMRLHSAP